MSQVTFHLFATFVFVTDVAGNFFFSILISNMAVCLKGACLFILMALGLLTSEKSFILVKRNIEPTGQGIMLVLICYVAMRSF